MQRPTGFSFKVLTADKIKGPIKLLDNGLYTLECENLVPQLTVISALLENMLL